MSSHINLQRDIVDERLKADAEALRATYIDDAGFTLRVMDALPARTAILPTPRIAWPLGGAVIAALLAALFSPIGNFVIAATMDILTETPTTRALAMVPVLTPMAGMTIA